MTEILQTRALYAGYGKKRVLRDVTIDAAEGAIVAIIGHNGAGKSTLLHTVFGLLMPDAGEVFYDGKRITRQSPSDKLKQGIALIPQGRNVFGDLTVRDHIRLVAREVGYAEAEKAVVQLFPVLEERLTVRAGSLSGGQRQMLAVACGVLRRPRLMLIDEPSIGLAPFLVDRVLESLRIMRDEHAMTIVVVEQNVKKVIEVADQVYAIRNGQVIYSGSGEQTRAMAPKELWQYC